MTDRPRDDAGRYVTEGEPLDVTMPVRASQAQRKRWRRAAKVSGRSAGDVAREALDAWADGVLSAAVGCAEEA